MPENTTWSAKIKRSGFLPEPESASFVQCRMQKIASLNFCAPELSILGKSCRVDEEKRNPPNDD
ncbi:hypothetical protein QUF90_25905 [Desulfococcaceae bacterium HSG9]|nr:hypothetical protein [Desulfococcaceae bacterium HSG9]